MSDFRVRPGKPVAHELARVIGAQLKRARARLGDSGEEPEAAFHDARRRLKKARAAARIARLVDKALARAIGGHARDAARVLSEARDADVVAAAARTLAADTRLAEAAVALARFADRAAGAAPRGQDRRALADAATAELNAALALVPKLAGRDAPAKTWRRAATKAADRATDAFDVAHRPNGSEELRHEWRKRVKELSHVERLLVDVWPFDETPNVEDAKALGGLLGEERDLALLAEALKRGARACGGAAARDAALAAVEARRSTIAEQALALGRVVHREPEDA